MTGQVYTSRDLTLLALVLAADEAEHQAIIEDQHAERLAPSNAARPLHAHELTSRTRFADIEDDRDQAVAEAEELLAGLHQDIREQLLQNLFGGGNQEITSAQAVEIIHHLATQQPEEIQQAESNLVMPIAGILAALYLISGRRVVEEAGRQGVDVSNVAPAQRAAEQFQPNAQAVVTHPWRRIAGKLEEQITSQPVVAGGTVTRAQVDQILQNIKIDGSRDQARQAINQASGTGRNDTVDQAPELEPDQIWASAILDGNACDDCVDLDGEEFASLEEAREYFPNGQNINCQGQSRCRCVLIFVFAA